jgi:hypothetical protein
LTDDVICGQDFISVKIQRTPFAYFFHREALMGGPMGGKPEKKGL